MEIYQLKSFVAVAEEKKLTRAAERLFTSQPAVSAHIKSLEAELGVTLFARTARGMEITEDGQKLLEHSQQILGNVKELNELARELQAQPNGVLRVGINSGSNDLKLGKIAQALQQRYPEIQLDIMHAGSGNIHKAILNDDLDIGFFEGLIESPLISGLKIGSAEVRIVGSRDYKETFESSNWSSLEKLPWVFNSPECSYHSEILRICQANELTLNKRFTIDDETTSLHFVRNGIAISLTNMSLISTELKNGELIAWKAYRGTLEQHLICLSKRRNDRAIKAFTDATCEIHNL
ncbi:LysR family transcriptional regulator [Puniceicoccaceae bacterium K14]|nr:LysR family transcriptional regulator [Puniceicoccaceae bacterium K14]